MTMVIIFKNRSVCLCNISLFFSRVQHFTSGKFTPKISIYLGSMEAKWTREAKVCSEKLWMSSTFQRHLGLLLEFPVSYFPLNLKSLNPFIVFFFFLSCFLPITKGGGACSWSQKVCILIYFTFFGNTTT